MAAAYKIRLSAAALRINPAKEIRARDLRKGKGIGLSQEERGPCI